GSNEEAPVHHATRRRGGGVGWVIVVTLWRLFAEAGLRCELACTKDRAAALFRGAWPRQAPRHRGCADRHAARPLGRLNAGLAQYRPESLKFPSNIKCDV